MTEELLARLLAQTPLMEPIDGVKLLYQSEFGCGHLIEDEGACLEYLRRELAQTPVSAAASLCVPIGNGLCRLNLASPAAREIRPERIAAMMRLTAQSNRGSREGLERGLSLLAALAEAGRAPFSGEALQAYLADYRRAGYPVVSHSPAYRAAYAPAYRVIQCDFVTLWPLILKIDAASPSLAVLDGLCGAGKTTLCALLCALYQAPSISMDDFFLPPSLRTKERLQTPGGNVHYERFLAQVMPFLQSPDAFTYFRYDCRTGEQSEKRCPAAPLRVVEGSYSLHPAFLDGYRAANAVTAFATTSPEEQLRRLALRNPAMLPRFQAEWIPLEKSYFEAYDVKRRADVALTSLPWEG